MVNTQTESLCIGALNGDQGLLRGLKSTLWAGHHIQVTKWVYSYFVFVTTLGQCNSGNLVCLGVFAAGHSSANKKQMRSKTQSPLADFH